MGLAQATVALKFKRLATDLAAVEIRIKNETKAKRRLLGSIWTALEDQRGASMPESEGDLHGARRDYTVIELHPYECNYERRRCVVCKSRVFACIKFHCVHLIGAL
jgi:hypothetical protein